ncbi:hypothetical protein KIH27_15955 [Mycobacterium sp. M1]|uniref:Uncharacterized protein n=1 Tax=Mycolicibacter acidiphilus TaxID=2835306 RepID=A0ABS5RL94_9MYCO|nr:hypothetical protein [Mycolicibacter acidiphilus]MBS9535082.1 hypothetical protein [Mycolicibacter acidiphilus]
MDTFVLPTGNGTKDRDLAFRLDHDLPWLALSRVITTDGALYASGFTPLMYALGARARAVIVAHVPSAGWVKLSKDAITWGATARDVRAKDARVLIKRADMPLGFDDTDLTVVLAHPGADTVSVLAGSESPKLGIDGSVAKYGMSVIDAWRAMPSGERVGLIQRADFTSRGADLLAAHDRRRRDELTAGIETLRIPDIDPDLLVQELVDQIEKADALLPVLND